MTTPTIALVGAGSMGSNHARVIAGADRATLGWVVDPHRAAGEALAQAHGARWVPDLDDVSRADAVVIASATETHLDLAVRTIERGLPVLVEKPLCPSLADTSTVVSLSEQRDVPLMCGFLERYNPAFIVARSMLSDPVHVRAARHSPYAPRIRTGVAWDLLVHDVDLITQIFSGQDVASVAVEVGQFHPSSVPGAEDIIETSLRFADGSLAAASASRLGQQKLRSLVIYELDRMIEVDLLRRGVTSYRHTRVDAAEAGTTFRQATEIEIPEVVGREPLATQLDRFLDLIAGRIDADAERRSALPAHHVVERALESSRSTV